MQARLPFVRQTRYSWKSCMPSASVCCSTSRIRPSCGRLIASSDEVPGEEGRSASRGFGPAMGYVAVQVDGACWRTIDLGSELKWAVRRNSRLELPSGSFAH